MHRLAADFQSKMSEVVLGVGVDILEIDRIRWAHLRWGSRFLRKIFLPEEADYCFRQSNPYPSLGARFAAKEAVAKALGTGIGREVSFRNILLTKNAAGAPQIFLSGEACHVLHCLGGSRVLISISHGRTHAVAYALIC